MALHLTSNQDVVGSTPILCTITTFTRQVNVTNGQVYHRSDSEAYIFEVDGFNSLLDYYYYLLIKTRLW